MSGPTGSVEDIPVLGIPGTTYDLGIRLRLTYLVSFDQLVGRWISKSVNGPVRDLWVSGYLVERIGVGYFSFPPLSVMLSGRITSKRTDVCYMSLVRGSLTQQLKYTPSILYKVSVPVETRLRTLYSSKNETSRPQVTLMEVNSYISSYIYIYRCSGYGPCLFHKLFTMIIIIMKEPPYLTVIFLRKFLTGHGNFFFHLFYRRSVSVDWLLFTLLFLCQQSSSPCRLVNVTFDTFYWLRCKYHNMLMFPECQNSFGPYTLVFPLPDYKNLLDGTQFGSGNICIKQLINSGVIILHT